MRVFLQARGNVEFQAEAVGVVGCNTDMLRFYLQYFKGHLSVSDGVRGNVYGL